MKRSSAWIMAATLFALAALFAMRFMTHALAYGLPAGLFAAIDSFARAALANPFSIDFSSQAVCMTGAVVFIGPLVFIALSYYSSRNRAKESGKEHGEERFATKAEAAEFADTKDFANNLWYSKNCGLLFRAKNKKQRDLQYALNFNMICYGTSGTGKSFNLAKVAMLQSIGDALKPAYTGLKNIFSHIKDTLVLDKLVKKLSIWLYAHIRKASTPLAAQPSRPVSALSTTAEKVSSAYARIKSTHAAKRWINEGFDIFNTDAKGDNLQDAGHLFEAADYDIKCFDTINFDKSLHYNPLAYIDTRLVDIKNPDDLANDLRIDFENGTTERLALDGEVAMTSRTKATRQGTVIMDTDVVRHTVTYDNLEQTDDTIKKDLESISARLGKNVEEAVRGFSYKRSEVAITLTYRNTDWREHSPILTLDLDPALEAVSMESLEEQGATLDPTTNVLTWDTGVVEGREKDIEDALAPARILKVFLRIKPMRVADGVSLTKHVNCLVKNLNEDVRASGDMKFWEDTKLLAFMSYVALQFERYDPEYRNLPTTLKILNMAMVDSESPNTPSQLDILMEAWETGFIFLPDQDEKPRGPRSKRKGGSWQLFGCDPHDPALSMALHCYKAYNVGATETRQSILASCHAAFTKLLGEDVQELLRYDEMALDTLGEAGQKQAIFVVPNAVDDTFGFLFALMTFQAMNSFCERSINKHKGRMPRHVRFEIDEAGTIGKITMLDRIIAVIRSFNGSVALYFQSKKQVVKVYGENEAEIIIDNCTTTTFLGSQSKDTLEMVSTLIGDETVYGATSQRTFDACGFATTSNEHVQATARKVRSSAQLRRENKRKMLVFILGMRPVLDRKFPTEKHPLYRYIDPTSLRALTQPPCLFNDRFDYQDYLIRKERRKAA